LTQVRAPQPLDDERMRILTLALLAPLTAEFLLGDQYLTGPPELGRQLGMFALDAAGRPSSPSRWPSASSKRAC
jgi:hypothetical protein